MSSMSMMASSRFAGGRPIQLYMLLAGYFSMANRARELRANRFLTARQTRAIFGPRSLGPVLPWRRLG